MGLHGAIIYSIYSIQCSVVFLLDSIYSGGLGQENARSNGKQWLTDSRYIYMYVCCLYVCWMCHTSLAPHILATYTYWADHSSCDAALHHLQTIYTHWCVLLLLEHNKFAKYQEAITLAAGIDFRPRTMTFEIMHVRRRTDFWFIY